MGACHGKSRYDASDGGRGPTDRAAAGAGRGRGRGSGSDATGVVLLSTTYTDPVFDCSVVGDGAGGHSTTCFATCGDDGNVSVVNWSDGRVVRSWAAHDRSVNRMSCSLDGRVLATASRDMTVKLWHGGAEATESQPVAVLAGHTLNVGAVDISPDATLVCSGSRDTSVRLWDVVAAKQVSQHAVPRNTVTDIAWIQGGSTTVAQASEDLTIRLWDVRTPTSLKVASALSGFVYFPLCVSSSSDGTYLLSSSKGFNAVGAEARLWDLRTNTEVRQFVGHAFDATACAFLPPCGDSGPLIITASKDCSLRVWHRDTGECVFKHRDDIAGSFTALAVLPAVDASPWPLVAAVTITGGVRLFRVRVDTKTLECVAASKTTVTPAA